MQRKNQELWKKCNKVVLFCQLILIHAAVQYIWFYYPLLFCSLSFISPVVDLWPTKLFLQSLREAHGAKAAGHAVKANAGFPGPPLKISKA